MPRDYKREYANYHSSEEQKKNRAARNKARRQAIRDGKALCVTVLVPVI